MTGSPHPELLAAVADAQALCQKMLGTPYVIETYYPALHELVHRLGQVAVLPPCPSPWPWKLMAHSDIPKIKQDRQRVMLFVPRTVQVSGVNKQHKSHKEAKLLIGHWMTAVPAATIAATPGVRAHELVEKHGGYWASDKRGVKPIGGLPQLWCDLPIIEGVKQAAQ